MAAEDKRHTRLQKLSGSDFEMKNGQPDIRSWAVKDSADKILGKVKELIFDTQSRKIRYVVVDMDNNDYDLEGKKVMVPIGIAELAKKEDEVYLPGVTSGQLLALPEYNEAMFSNEDETNIRNVFGGLGATANNTGNEDDFYNHHHFNDQNLYRNRISPDDSISDKALNP